MIRRRGRATSIVVALLIGMATLGIVNAYANNLTYYVGGLGFNGTIYSSAPSKTTSVAKRDSNLMQCLNSSGVGYTCHARVFYWSSSLGSFSLVDNMGSSWYASEIYGSINAYAESRCQTDSGWGSNTGNCQTEWHV